MRRGDRRAARVHGAASRPVSVDALRRGGARRAAAGVGGRTTGGAAAAGGRSGCRAVILPPGGLLRLRDGRPSVIAAGRAVREGAAGVCRRSVRAGTDGSGDRSVRAGPEGCCAVLRATKKPTSGNEGRLFCRSGGVCPVRWRAVASVGGRCRCTCRVGRSAVREGVDRRRRPGPERALSGAGQRGYVLSVRRGGGTGRQSSKETAPASSAVKGTV